MLHPGFLLHGGRYRLLSRLRDGATAQVWRALDAQQGKEVALKAIPLHAGGADAAEHEAEAVARVRHPGVIRVHGTFTEADHGWVAMELARCSLADVVAVHGVLDGPTTRAVAAELAEVLAATHAAGVVHRDLKPQNVLVLADGSVRLADFGIARVHARGQSRTAALIGTLPYLAPEQRRDPREVTPATDVYAWGILLAWLRTGVAPGEPYVTTAEDTLRARLLEAGESDTTLVEVILAATRYEAKDRPANGEALRASVARTWTATGPARVRVTEPFSETWVDGGHVPVDGLGAGGSRPPQRPPGLRAEKGQRTGWTAPRAWGLAIASLAVGAGAAYVGMNSSKTSVPASSPTTNLDNRPPCAEIAENYITVRTNGPREVVASSFDDLDDDGFDDALFVSQLDEQVLVYRGGRSPKLEAPIVIPIERAGVPVHAVDVDGNGRKDILALHQDAAKWKAYGLDEGYRVVWTKEWQEELGSGTEWDVLNEADGVKILYGSNTDDCMLERTITRGEIQPARCAWSSLVGRVISVHARRDAVVATVTKRDNNELTSMVFAQRTRTAERHQPGRTWPWAAGSQLAWLTAKVDNNTGQISISRSDGTSCLAIAPRGVYADIGDWNGDERADIISTSTCGGCTSEMTIRLSNAARPQHLQPTANQ